MIGDTEAKRLLERARVPPEGAHGKAWRLRYAFGMTDEEIAVLLAVKVGTVRAHVSKATRELRQGRG